VCRIRRVAIAASQARPRAASKSTTCPPANAGGGIVPPVCVPHPSRRDRSEPSTSPCRSRLANPRPPANAGGWMLRPACHLCVCRIRRIAIAGSRARPRAARASRPPNRLPTPAVGLCAGRATYTCVFRIRRVAIATSRTRPRAARASRPPDSPPRPAAGYCAERHCHLCVCVPHPARRDPSEPIAASRDIAPGVPPVYVPHPARRDRREPSTSPCRFRLPTPTPPASAAAGCCAGRATCVCAASGASRSQRASTVPCLSCDSTSSRPAVGCVPGGASMRRIRRVATAASRARHSPSRAAAATPAARMSAMCTQHPPTGGPVRSDSGKNVDIHRLSYVTLAR
jgi:hypothetical protein